MFNTFRFVRLLSLFMFLVLLVGIGDGRVVSAGRVIAPEELQGNIGAMVTLPVLGLLFAKGEFTISDVSGQLLFSDNPESITGEGIAYRDVVSGYARVYVYHANAATQHKYFLTWLVNHSDEPVTVHVLREALGGPGVDYGYIGQTVLEEYFGPQVERTIVIAPHGRELLDVGATERPARQHALIHGIYDIVVDGSIEVLVTAVNSVVTDPTSLPDLEAHDPVGYGRGIFEATERHMNFTVGDVPAGVLIASGRPEDPWIAGHDIVFDRSAYLGGNYGVVYHIDMTVEVSKPKRVLFFMAPGFSGGCPMSPSIRITGDDHTYHGADELGLVVRVPHNGDLVITRPEPAAFLGEIFVTPDDPRTLRLDFMPPGGSCLAAALIAWPVDIEGPGLHTSIRGLDDALVPWESPAELYDPFDAKTSYWSWSQTPPVFKDGHAVWGWQAYGNAFAGLEDGRDYAMEIRAQFDAPGTFSVFLRSDRLWKGYEALVDVASNRVMIRRLKGTWDFTDILASASLQGKVKVGEWFTVRAEVVGNRITAYVNDEQVLSVVDAQETYTSGRAGFRVGYTQMRLDYARLTVLE